MKFYRILVLSIIALAFTGCQSSQEQQAAKAQQEAIAPIKQAFTEAAAAGKACREKMLSGELPTYVASQKCANPGIIEAFQNIDFPYMDLVKRYTAQALKVAKEIDEGKITEKQAKLELQDYFKGIIAEIKQRKIAEAQAERDRQQKEEADRIREAEIEARVEKAREERAEAERTRAEKAELAKKKKDQLNADKEKCDSYDIKRGTAAFSECLIQIDQARQQQEQQQQNLDAQQQQQDQLLEAQREMQQQAIQGQQRAAVVGALLNNMRPPPPPQTLYVVPVSPVVAPYMR